MGIYAYKIHTYTYIYVEYIQTHAWLCVKMDQYVYAHTYMRGYISYIESLRGELNRRSQRSMYIQVSVHTQSDALRQVSAWDA